MRAAVLHAPNQPLVIEEVDLADPGPGEVRVRVQAAGVCHSDLHYTRGDLRSLLPVVLGHEGVGVVRTVGPGVTAVRPGDRIVFTWRPRCGECEFCSRGRPELCVQGKVQAAAGSLPNGHRRLSRPGGPLHHLMGVSCFAEECVVSDRSVVRIPDDVPTSVAAIMGCAVITGVGAVLNHLSSAAAEPVIVFGAGGVGLNAILGLTLIGADPMIIVDPVAERRELALSLGATHAFDPRQLPGAVTELVPDGVRWAIDAVGQPTTMEAAFSSLGPSGTLVALGLGSTDAEFRVGTNLLVQQERRIIGSLYGSASPVVQLPKVLRLYHSGRLPLERLIGTEYTLDEVGSAFEALAAGEVGRSFVRIGE